MREPDGAATSQQQLINNIGGANNHINSMMVNQQNLANSVPHRNPMSLMNGGGNNNIAMADP